ncbi:MAG TPA: choice-of-anchor D domain-containing protein, partial [Bryobacteraceae bacterium]
SAVAGNWGYGYSGDGGSAVDASLASPAGVRVDAAGDIYIADFGNSVIRQVQAASGKIVTIAGSGATDYSGDGGDPTLAALKNPDAIALDSAGSLYISDYSNNVIRKVSFPAPLSFPDENVGALSAAQVITAFNIGNRNLTLNALSLTADFALQASGDIDCAAPSSVSPGASCSIAIGFSPTAAGSRAGTLQLTTNSLSAASSSQTVNLSGTGTGSLATAPKASLSTTTLNFGSQGTWTTSGAQSVTLSNPGGSDTNISSIWLAGSDSSDFRIIAMTCGSVLTAGANCTVSVTFSPTASGARTATLSFADSVAGSPQIVTLNGAGVGGSVSLSPSTLVFSQQLGVPSAAQTVTFSNIGAYPVSIGSILLSGANVSDFSLSTTCGSSRAAGAHCTASATFTPLAAGVRTASLVFTDDAAGSSQTVTLSGAGVDVPVSAGLRFIPVAPCRVADTRWDPGPFGGPMIGHDSSRDFVIPNSSCGIPATAKAYSLNVTVVPAGIIGYLEIWPTGQPQPVASLLNSDGRVKANAAIVPAGTNGAVSVYSSDPTQVILDINGYFVPASDPAGLAFYPLTPCRVADTRDGNFAPALSKDEIRIFKVATKCGVPASAAAYSMNVTVVPRGVIGFLSAFPAGQNLPNSSTLNSNGAVLANAAIVPAGANGSVAVYSSDPTDVVLDIDGYFAPPATGGLSLFNLTPCRVYDSRFAGPPPHTPVSGTLAIGVASSPCAVPLGAQAYVLNTTVVPASDLGALTLYPNGAPTPLASTLNADDLAVTSNMAIIPTTNGLVNAWASSSTHLILDVYGYFAP